MLFGISAQVDDFEWRPSRAAYTQYVYSPGGNKLAVVQNGALVKGTIPLPGGETAIYNASGLNFLRHKDWLGSSRLATTWAHGVYAKEAYAPFGETYNEAGTPDRSFTGQDQDVTAGVYDYLFRKYDPAAGRWLSPDPSGWKAVSQSYPQSLNRYAYVQNNPMTLIDPNGLDCVYVNNDGNSVESIDKNSDAGECGYNGGTWVPGTVSMSTTAYDAVDGIFIIGSFDGSMVDMMQVNSGEITDANGGCLYNCNNSSFSTASYSWLASMEAPDTANAGGITGLLNWAVAQTSANRVPSWQRFLIQGNGTGNGDGMWAGPEDGALHSTITNGQHYYMTTIIT